MLEVVGLDTALEFDDAKKKSNSYFHQNQRFFITILSLHTPSVISTNQSCKYSIIFMS